MISSAWPHNLKSELSIILRPEVIFSSSKQVEPIILFDVALSHQCSVRNLTRHFLRIVFYTNPSVLVRLFNYLFIYISVPFFTFHFSLFPSCISVSKMTANKISSSFFPKTFSVGWRIVSQNTEKRCVTSPIKL
jgi:hypothetical protein